MKKNITYKILGILMIIYYICLFVLLSVISIIMWATILIIYGINEFKKYIILVIVKYQIVLKNLEQI